MQSQKRFGASPPLSTPLLAAGLVVMSVRRGRSADEQLNRTPQEVRPAARAIAFEALRHLTSLTHQLSTLVKRQPDTDVQGLLIVGLALLRPYSREQYAAHTVVDQAVDAARGLPGRPAAFVNAVLRSALRAKPLVHSPSAALSLKHEHPDWWIAALRRDWPNDWETILSAANLAPPMFLRVNRRQHSGEAYARMLASAGIEADLLPGRPLGGQAIALHEPCPVTQLPGFAQGSVSVQDLSAQRAGPLLLEGGLLPRGARVLDACSAPGGKAAHLLELADLDLLCIDSDPHRLGRVHDTLSRLQLRAQVKEADASEPGRWWDGRPFDAILLDAPCSASGIVRRHPDIRWLRRPDDIQHLAATQDRLLDALWPLLKPGGHLLFATCSVFKEEGCHRIDAFLQRQPPGAVQLLPSSPGHLLPVAENAVRADSGREWLPDGFFYAHLKKLS